MLNRLAIAVAIYALIVIGSGAIVTSSEETLAADKSNPAEPPTGAGVHPILGGVLAGLILALTVAVWRSQRGLFGVITFALILSAADVVIALWPPVSAGRAVWHAWISAALLSTLCAIAFLTSEHWQRTPQLVGDNGLHFLRPLAISTPPIVLMQVALGALYRHKVTSVFWHMGGALLASLATLLGSMVVIQQFPAHRALQNSAIALMSIVLAQVALGVTAFTLQLLDTGTPLALELATVSHVLVGNLTLAASLIFALEVHRSVRRGVAPSE